MSRKSSKRPWRKLLKKLQRKRRRQKLAIQNDKELEDAEFKKLQDPLYKSWLEQQAAIERQQQLQDEIIRQELEELWLRRELLAQQHFKREELKRKAEEAKLEAERMKQEEQLKLQDEIRKKKREEIKLQAEKADEEFESIITSIKEYLEDMTMKTPKRLEIIIESRPGEKSCEFFEKTNCCRFDPGCTFNHKRPMMGKIILIKHFFQHPLLGTHEHEEYSKSDSDLELSERDLRDAYDEFCEDVWPVLEEFGSIVNFRTVRNVHSHLRGHVFVEYLKKRSALKAFINLQNRYYASKRLNVEFSNLQMWHKGVCGMRLKGLSLSRKCSKGGNCNFLHIMKNISNKYNQPIHNPERSLRKTPQIVQETSWDCEKMTESSLSQSRNWRWSESPELELKSKLKDENLKTGADTEKSACSDSKSNSPSSQYSNKSNTSSYRRNSERNKTSYKRSRRKSSISSRSHHKSRTKSSITDSKHTKSKKSKDRMKDRNPSQKRCSSSVLRHYKKFKRAEQSRQNE